jgi:hypothetical protein
MEDVGIFYVHLVYFTSIQYILWTLGIFCVNLVHLSPFGILYQEKSGNPDTVHKSKKGEKKSVLL